MATKHAGGFGCRPDGTAYAFTGSLRKPAQSQPLSWLELGPWTRLSGGLAKTPADAAALLLAFYITMVAVLAGTILLFGTTRFLGPEGRRALILISAATLGVLGIYQLVASVLRTATG